ncbi:hypothetical protein BJY04DRAFT_216392 [Aspergillus karnatakaensis]|uniref:uncharacterized protein n=1 Tax=Aspergillus karnatakaensis TaxID=1810916 RepID=UPI003CCD5E1F
MASAEEIRKEAARHWAAAKTAEWEDGQEEEFAQLKQDLVKEYGEENLRKGWLEVTAALAKEAEIISSRGSSIIPVVEIDQLDGLPQETIDEIKHRGAVVFRNVLSQEHTLELQAELDKYLRDNENDIAARPPPNPWLFESFYSPVQHKVRTNSNSIKAQRFLNNLWTGYSPDEALPEPIVYADSLRHRRPGGFSPTAQPHIDAGSLDRWADENYRHFYDAVFRGSPLDYDPYDVKKRIAANQAKFPGRSQSTVFRSFQGWTSLSSSGAEFGRSSLAICPNLKLAQAYVLLRPFFKPSEGEGVDASDPATWVLDDSGAFPGAAKGRSQWVVYATHPHLQLEKTLTLTPEIHPGDAVFWHSDIIHAVDPANNTDQTATVLYIPAVPLTRKSVTYLKEQRDSLLANGQIPPDFNTRSGKSGESRFNGWLDVHAAIGDNVQGRRAYGLEKLEGEEGIVQWANEVLGFV